MSMTPAEIKAKLPRGAQAAVARQTNRTEAHVSYVVNGYRRDPVVEREISAVLGLPVAKVFGAPVGKGQSNVLLRMMGR